LQQAQRVGGGEIGVDVAENGRQPDHVQLWRAQREEDRHRVVDAGIGVDNDFARHYTLSALAASAMAIAICAPTRALLTSAAMLATFERPSVSSSTRASTNGVTSLPWMPCSSASRVAWAIACSASSIGSASASGTGTATSVPCCRPSAS